MNYHHIHQVATYILGQFSVCYSVADIDECLHHHGFSYKNKPKGISQKLYEAKQN
ncbi:TPA: winged helix-turn-helix domain-containing protein [Photobacterium damselae]